MTKGKTKETKTKKKKERGAIPKSLIEDYITSYNEALALNPQLTKFDFALRHKRVSPFRTYRWFNLPKVDTDDTQIVFKDYRKKARKAPTEFEAIERKVKKEFTKRLLTLKIKYNVKDVQSFGREVARR